MIVSRKLNALAIVALALGVLGTIVFFAVDIRAILLSLAAIILGIVANRQIRARRENGRWVANTAIIVGAITPIAALLVLFGLFAASLADT